MNKGNFFFIDIIVEIIVNLCGVVNVCKVFDIFLFILLLFIMLSWMRIIYCVEMCWCKVMEIIMLVDLYDEYVIILKKNKFNGI